MLFVCSSDEDGSGNVKQEGSNAAGAGSVREDEGSDDAAESRWLLLNVDAYGV
jgi:hypothetical protein